MELSAKFKSLGFTELQPGCQAKGGLLYVRGVDGIWRHADTASLIGGDLDMAYWLDRVANA